MDKEIRKTDYKILFKRIYTSHPYLFSFFLLMIIQIIINPSILSFASLSTLMMQSTIKGILALGMTVVIISGMIDLSVGANMALTAGLGVLVLNATGSPWIMLAFCVVCATLLSTISGLFVTKGKIAAFIVTLAMMSIFRSIIVQLGQGGPFNVNADILKSFRLLASGTTLKVHNLAIIFFVLTIILNIVASKTKFGRYVYAIGSNETAAKLTGVNIDRVKTITFSLMGFLVGITAFLFASRLTSVTAATAGMGYELDAIAAVAIGGTQMSGGRGKIFGTFFGALILQMIEGVLVAARIPPFLTGLVKGVIILAAVLLQSKKNAEGLH